MTAKMYMMMYYNLFIASSLILSRLTQCNAVHIIYYVHLVFYGMQCKCGNFLFCFRVIDAFSETKDTSPNQTGNNAKDVNAFKELWKGAFSSPQGKQILGKAKEMAEKQTSGAGIYLAN